MTLNLCEGTDIPAVLIKPYSEGTWQKRPSFNCQVPGIVNQQSISKVLIQQVWWTKQIALVLLDDVQPSLLMIQSRLPF